MRILLDILHPAHVHFFRNAIGELREAGCQVRVTARDKDLTLTLLDLYAIPYTCISREARTAVGRARELFTRNLRMLRVARRFKPSVMASVGGVSTAQVGFITRTRNLVFYDTECALTSNLMTYPFASQVLTPSCYKDKVFGRHVPYSGYHELAYLHPRRFKPDRTALTSCGFDPCRIFSVVRFVSWAATHDLRAHGLGPRAKAGLIQKLKSFGDVFISSEMPLPTALEPYRLTLPPDRMHHLLGFASLYVGESATMASESAVLGTPAVYIDPQGRGYTDELEERYGLCQTFHPNQFEKAVAKCLDLLRSDAKRSPKTRERVRAMLCEKQDVTSIIVTRLSRPAGEDPPMRAG